MTIYSYLLQRTDYQFNLFILRAGPAPFREKFVSHNSKFNFDLYNPLTGDYGV